ncbi:MAG: class I SAM-dependent methyltransferase [Deltaproteobacteria bacterium]|nr:class I SAM-dependent methyltransferase [Deltaproteobacteria bacterium]MBW2383895.1 class I SAM-dependent methyltransferase [Deltaproteobacteria bacterium]
MSSLALMRWLEGTPERYDAGMRALTLGRVAMLHAAVAEASVREPGDRVLEIGCGTGAVTQRLCARGARVTAIDQAPEMIEQAMARVRPSHAGPVTWLEQTASEIDRLPAGEFDAVVLSLCLSDMSPGERSWVLKRATERLAPGGRLIAADEVRAPAGWRRAAQVLWRIPQAAIGWLLVGSLSRPVPNLCDEIRATGLPIRSQTCWLLGSLQLVVAQRAA